MKKNKSLLATALILVFLWSFMMCYAQNPMDKSHSNTGNKIKNILTREQAKDIAYKEIRKFFGADFVIQDNLTKETAQSWIFYYTTQKFLKTRDRKDIPLGNEPIIISKGNGDFRFFSSIFSYEENVKEYEGEMEKEK